MTEQNSRPDSAGQAQAQSGHEAGSRKAEQAAGWLLRSVAALEQEVASWPAWKRDAADTEPFISIPGERL
jgi:hypothetical protein